MRGSYAARIMRKWWEAATAHRLPAWDPLPSPAQHTCTRSAVVSSVSLCRYVVMSSGVARCRQVSLCVVMSSCGHAPLCRYVVTCRYVVMCRHVALLLCRYVVMSSRVAMCRYVVSVVMSLHRYVVTVDLFQCPPWRHTHAHHDTCIWGVRGRRNWRRRN